LPVAAGSVLLATAAVIFLHSLRWWSLQFGAFASSRFPLCVFPLLSLLVLPLYLPTLIFGAEAAQRGAAGADASTPMLLLAGISAATIALMPFASAAVLKVNLQ
jgi:hypothetical protein